MRRSLWPGVILDYDEAGNLIGIEILDASSRTDNPRLSSWLFLHNGSKAKVYRADLYGLRESKYSYLWENDVASTQWEEVKPQTPFYLFEKQNAGLLEEYQRGWSVTKTMPVNVLGFQTHRDKFL